MNLVTHNNGEVIFMLYRSLSNIYIASERGAMKFKPMVELWIFKNNSTLNLTDIFKITFHRIERKINVEILERISLACITRMLVHNNSKRTKLQ